MNFSLKWDRRDNVMFDRIFLIVGRRIIGLMFLTGPLGFPGFCRGVRMPCPRLMLLCFSHILVEVFAYFDY